MLGRNGALSPVNHSPSRTNRNTVDDAKPPASSGAYGYAGQFACLVRALELGRDLPASTGFVMRAL